MIHEQKYCRNCGIKTPLISKTKGYRDYCCQACTTEHVRKIRLENAIKKLDDFGFDYHGGYGYTHSYVDVTNRKCGHTFSVRYLNIFTNPDYCPTCGNAIKYEKLVARNVAGAKDWKYRESFDEYRRMVNLLTARTYRKYKHEINPLDLPKGRIDTHENPHHVDHIVPVKYCFENEIPPSRCASKENLRMMPALENMKKYSKITEDAKNVLTKWKCN